METIEFSEQSYYKNNNKKEYILNFNISNALVIFSKISDFYTFVNYAFLSIIPWGFTTF